MKIRILEGVSISAIRSAWHPLLVDLIFEARSADDPEVVAAFRANSNLGSLGAMVEILGGEHREEGYAVRGQDLLSTLAAMLSCVSGLEELLGWLLLNCPGLRDGWIVFGKSTAQEIGDFH